MRYINSHFTYILTYLLTCLLNSALGNLGNDVNLAGLRKTWLQKVAK